jgi:hypothetical protein
MTKATRVHSTPRRTASKIKPSTADDAGTLREHATAYSLLEPAICDAANMAAITTQAMCEADGNAGEDEKRLAYFAVYHLCDMVRDLRETYYGRGRVA